MIYAGDEFEKCDNCPERRFSDGLFCGDVVRGNCTGGYSIEDIDGEIRLERTDPNTQASQPMIGIRRTLGTPQYAYPRTKIIQLETEFL